MSDAPKLIAAYRGRCAVTNCDAHDALEAAHIMPYHGPASNHVANGLLLRADIHTLFDLNLIGIEPRTFTISLAEVLEGTAYVELDWRKLRRPYLFQHRPSPEALTERWIQFKKYKRAGEKLDSVRLKNAP
jgi:predicted restriction endonuclease